jgi:putative endopeptidase
MRVLALAAGLALALSACAPKAEAPPAKPKFGAWGLATSEMDKTVKPGDDFFDYAVGSWVKTAKIPPDRTFAGVDLAIFDQIDEDVKAIIEETAAKKAPAGQIDQKIGDFYAAYMDEARADAKGAEPIRADLATIDAAPDKAALAPILARLGMAGAVTPFQVYVDIDPKDPTRYLPVIWQSGLSFGQRDYYLKTTKDFADLRAKFLAHAEKLLSLAGYNDAKAQAAQILALETKLAKAQWPLDKERIVDLTVTTKDRAATEKLAAGAPLGAILDAENIHADTYRIGMPDVLTKTAQIYAGKPLGAWKAYLRYQTISAYGPYLAKPFADEVFDFEQRTLNGVETQRARWKRGVSLVNTALGEAVGQLYVAKRFPASSKKEAEALVEYLRRAYGARIDKAAWMAPETKKEAQDKLAKVLAKIGYPDTWKSYDTVTIKADDLVGDVKSADAWAWNDQIGKLGKPVDRAEWLMTPQTDNAYYRPETNEICFPAAILQPPYFDPAADAVVNYGAIGATIGHELSHGFDDQGRKQDAQGKLRDWWTPADAKRYDAEADKLAKQFDAYEPLPGLHINGKQTLGENIADLAGLRIAYDAYKLSLGGREAPVIDGLTGDQRFFLAYAASWKTIQRTENQRDRLLSDVHSPAKYRVNGIVRNMDEWYTAFNVQPGDKLYLKPEARVRIW